MLEQNHENLLAAIKDKMMRAGVCYVAWQISRLGLSILSLAIQQLLAATKKFMVDPITLLVLTHYQT